MGSIGRTAPSTALALCLLAGCDHVPTRNAALLAGTIVAGHIPTAQMNQVYYLGVFDPRDQVPPTIYRLRVQGQASMLNATKFASGWVHADFVDSLSSSGTNAQSLQELGGKEMAGSAQQPGTEKGLLTGRRLVMFGPEGFREAPKDHRLVVVMGSNPDAFFGAIDSAAGVIAEATQGTTAGPEATRAILLEMSRLRAESKSLADVLNAMNRDDAVRSAP